MTDLVADVTQEIGNLACTELAKHVHAPLMEGLYGDATPTDTAMNIGSLPDPNREFGALCRPPCQQKTQAFPAPALKGKDPSKKDKNHWSTEVVDDPKTPYSMTWLIRAINHIAKQAKHEEGLFRKSGSEKNVKKLMIRVNNNECCSYNDADRPHDLVTLVKRFLLNLSSPLIPLNQFGFWLQVAELDSKSTQIECARWLMLLLPRSRHVVCKHLFACLNKVLVANEQGADAKQAMTAQSLATVIGEAVMRMSGLAKTQMEPKQIAKQLKLQSEVMILLITKYDDIFEGQNFTDACTRIKKKAHAIVENDMVFEHTTVVDAKQVAQNAAVEARVRRYTDEKLENYGDKLDGEIKQEEARGSNANKQRLKALRKALTKCRKDGIYAGSGRSSNYSTPVKAAKTSNKAGSNTCIASRPSGLGQRPSRLAHAFPGSPGAPFSPINPNQNRTCPQSAPTKLRHPMVNFADPENTPPTKSLQHRFATPQNAGKPKTAPKPTPSQIQGMLSEKSYRGRKETFV